MISNNDGISERIYVSKPYYEEYYSEFHGEISYVDIKENFIDRTEAIYLIKKLKEVFDIKEEL